jgi:hypothetical protein
MPPAPLLARERHPLVEIGSMFVSMKSGKASRGLQRHRIGTRRRIDNQVSAGRSLCHGRRRADEANRSGGLPDAFAREHWGPMRQGID